MIGAMTRTPSVPPVPDEPTQVRGTTSTRFARLSGHFTRHWYIVVPALVLVLAGDTALQNHLYFRFYWEHRLLSQLNSDLSIVLFFLLVGLGICCLVTAVRGYLYRHTSARSVRPTPPRAPFTHRVTDAAASVAIVVVLLSLLPLGAEVLAARSCVSGAQSWNEIGQHACVTFRVARVGTSWQGDTFLDERTDYTRGFSVYVPNGSGLSRDQARSYMNKDIAVTGTITSYRGAPQIMVSDPSQVSTRGGIGGVLGWLLVVLVVLVGMWVLWARGVASIGHRVRSGRVRGRAPAAGQPHGAGSVRRPIARRPELDYLYEPALHAVYERGLASTALLQYRLQVPYATAAYLIQRMEDEQLVGPPDGARPRQIHTARLKAVLAPLHETDVAPQ